MAGRPAMPEAARFMLHVAKAAAGCWVWTAYKMPNGYGNFRTPQRHELAHRTAYRLFVGPIPDGLEILHSCDTPSCVNPEHLSLGTRVDNMQDARRKGRTAQGSRHGRSKLSDAEIAEIRVAPGYQWEVAIRYGITQSHVSAIRSGKRWAGTMELRS